jgi:hypothetical protein
MALFTDSNFQKIENAISYTEETIKQGFLLDEERFPERCFYVNSDRLKESYRLISEIYEIIKDLEKETYSTDLILADLLIFTLKNKLCFMFDEQNLMQSHIEGYTLVFEYRVFECNYFLTKLSELLLSRGNMK